MFKTFQAWESFTLLRKIKLQRQKLAVRAHAVLKSLFLILRYVTVSFQIIFLSKLFTRFHKVKQFYICFFYSDIFSTLLFIMFSFSNKCLIVVVLLPEVFKTHVTEISEILSAFLQLFGLKQIHLVCCLYTGIEVSVL